MNKIIGRAVPRLCLAAVFVVVSMLSTHAALAPTGETVPVAAHANGNEILLASGEGGGGGGGGGGGERFTPPSGNTRPGIRTRPPRIEFKPPAIFGSADVDEATTKNVVGFIRNGVRQAAGLPAEYRADYLAQVYRDAAAQLRGRGYAAARRELNNASRRIQSVVRRNLDRSKPPIRQGGRTVRAVKREALPKVNREVRQIVAETETRLIRSAGSSAKRRNHYSRIAQAVGSGKTILRS